jgi:hypothetical protein
MYLHTLVEQMRDWAEKMAAGETPIEAIVAGLREVADDVARSQGYSREERLGDAALESALIEQARDEYASGSDDNIEVDDDAIFSEGDSGCWVSAWVWVEQDEDEDEEESRADAIKRLAKRVECDAFPKPGQFLHWLDYVGDELGLSYRNVNPDEQIEGLLEKGMTLERIEQDIDSVYGEEADDE